MTDPPGPDFATLRRSTVLPGRRGRPERYPSRADYIEYLIRAGFIDAEAELAERPELVAAVHSHWHGTGHQGCRFAVFLSTRPAEHGWGRIVVSGARAAQWDDDLWREIAENVSLQIESPSAQALSLLFPGVIDVESLLELIHGLERRLGWTLQMLPQPDGGWRGSEPLVGLAFRVALTADVFAWPLGLGPFDFLPATRRAPVTEVILVVKPKVYPLRSKRITDDKQAAHLADMPVLVEDPAFDRLWTTTEKQKATILGSGPEPRAKARVTFVVPERVWNSRSVAGDQPAGQGSVL